jgi:hypothetical protein
MMEWPSTIIIITLPIEKNEWKLVIIKKQFFTNQSF